MIQECLELFEKNLKKDGERCILDRYIPKDGTYILIVMEENGWKTETPLELVYNKKKGYLEGRDALNFPFISQLDYYSKLIEMNKPIDPKKVIHSNNYFTLFVKKESLGSGKLTAEVINRYYEILKHPSQKYKGKGLKLYQEVEKQLGEVEQDELEQIYQWIKDNLNNLEINTKEKGYLKLFFVYADKEKTKSAYARENQRYVLPNIYNNNDYNVSVEGEIFGLPNNNLGMNTKKVYIANHSRKVIVPYLLNREKALLQAKFYDFLLGYVSEGKGNIYFDKEEGKEEIRGYSYDEHPEKKLNGYFLRIRKEKNEVEIQYADTVVGYNPNLVPVFYYKPVLKLRDTETESYSMYRMVNKRKELERLVDKVFFNGNLVINYFTKPEDINIYDGVLRSQIITCRSRLFSWFRLQNSTPILPFFQKIGDAMIKHSICCGYFDKAKSQINFICSLEDYFNSNKKKEEEMKQVNEKLWEHLNEKGDWRFDNDQEYYFAVGQMVSYFLSKSKAKKKPLSFVNLFLNARNDEMIKKRILMLFKKYNYDMDRTLVYNQRVERLFSNILLYDPEDKYVDERMVSAGLTAINLFYVSTKEEQ